MHESEEVHVESQMESSKGTGALSGALDFHWIRGGSTVFAILLALCILGNMQDARNLRSAMCTLRPVVLNIVAKLLNMSIPY